MSDEFERQLAVVKNAESDYATAKAFASLAGADISPQDKKALIEEAGKLYTLATGQKPPDLSTPEAHKKFMDDLVADMLKNLELEPNQDP